MADANSNLNIVVKVRDEASAALSRLSGDVSDLGGSLNFAGDKAGILASALAAVGATTVLKNAIGAFAEGEAQMARFDAIVRTLPPNLQALRGQMLELAETALTKFGFSNEEAAVNIARLVQASNSGPMGLQAFQAAMDLARYKNISLNDATQALILAFQGGGRVLKQLGIEVDDHASKETILAAVMKATSGQAVAHAATLQGQLQILTETLGEFSQALGGIFAPAIETAIGWMQKFLEAHGGLMATIHLLMPLLYGLAIFLSGVFVVGAIAATIAIGSMIGISGLVIAAIAALAAVVALFVTFWQDNWEQARAMFELFKINVVAIWSNMVATIKNVFGAAMGWIRDQLNGIVSFFNSVVNLVSTPIQSAQKGISSTLNAAGNAIKGVLGFAEGGIVTRPTLAMVGEGGESEAIIPLSRMGALGGGINIYLQGDFYSTTEVAEKFGNEIARIIKNNLNLSIRA